MILAKTNIHRQYKNQEESEHKILNTVYLSDGLESIEHLGFSTRTYNALVRSGRRTVSDLLQTPLGELREIRNLNSESIREIGIVLSNMKRQFKGK